MEKHTKVFSAVLSAAVATCAFAEVSLIPMPQKMSAAAYSVL